MASTTIANVVVPEVYDDYAKERSIYKSAVWKSGIVVTDPLLKMNLDGGAEVFNTPFWKSNTVISAAATPVVEGNTLTPGNIDAGQLIVRRQFREKEFGQGDVAAVLAGDSPIQATMELLGDFWDYNYQNVLFQSVQGVITDNVDNDGGTLVKDITGEGTTSINSNAVIDTNALFGDMNDGFNSIAMHSVPYTTLQKLDLIDFRPDSEQNIGFGTYLGKSVIVDDKLIVGGTVYWTILFKAGAFNFAESFERYVPTEVARTPAASGGSTELFTRRVFAMHPMGCAWVEAGVADDFPTDAELAAAAQWDSVVASAKNMGFAVLKTSS